MENPIQSNYQLEPQQYERLYFEEDIPLKDISRGLGPRLLGVGAFMVLVSVLVASYVTYPDQIELPFVFRGHEREWVYAFPFPVYVREVYVRPGDQVAAGQPLLRLTSPEIATMITELEGREARKETFETFTGSSYLRQMDILDKQIQQWQARARQLHSEIDILDQQWMSRAAMLDVVLAEAEDHVHTAKTLFAEGIVSRQEVQEKEKGFVQARDNRSGDEAAYKRERMDLVTQLEGAKQSIASVSLEKSKLEYDKAARSGDLGSEAMAAGDLIKSIFGTYRIEDGSVILLSPAAQQVSFVFEGEAEIPSGVTVLKLNPSARADYAFIKCPPSAAGRIKEDMKVKLKVASFPHYEWGVVQGTVATRSVTPDETGEYNLQVTVDDPGRLGGMLFPGLDGSAVIILEEKTLFQYFFRDLSKAYHGVVEGDFINPG